MKHVYAQAKLVRDIHLHPCVRRCLGTVIVNLLRSGQPENIYDGIDTFQCLWGDLAIVYLGPLRSKLLRRTRRRLASKDDDALDLGWVRRWRQEGLSDSES